MASSIVALELPAGAVTEAQVKAQFAAMENAEQSTLVYSGMVQSWSNQLQSDLRSEASAVSAKNKSNEAKYASAIETDSNNASGYLNAAHGWLNSASYELGLIKSEMSTNAYAKIDYPSSQTLENESIVAYDVAQEVFAADSSLPSGGDGLWGLFCAGTAIIGLTGAPESVGLSEAAAAAVQYAARLIGVGCALSAL